MCILSMHLLVHNNLICSHFTLLLNLLVLFNAILLSCCIATDTVKWLDHGITHHNNTHIYKIAALHTYSMYFLWELFSVGNCFVTAIVLQNLTFSITFK